MKRFIAILATVVMVLLLASPVLAADVPSIVAISVTPTSIDFGTLYPGQTSGETDITVDNIGTVKVNVDAELSEVGTVFDYLQLGGDYPPDYSGIWVKVIKNAQPGVSSPLNVQLVVPTTYSAKGVETATLIFTATPKKPV